MKYHSHRHMKKLIFFSLAFTSLILGGCAELKALFPGTGSQSGGLTTEEVIRGPHAINSTIIGNDIYFIDPQTDDYWVAYVLEK